jgi:hypothetical protein
MSVASVEEVFATYGRGAVVRERVRPVSTALLAALRRTGTAHVYGDTADREELGRVLTVGAESSPRSTGTPSTSPLCGAYWIATWRATG